MSDSNVYTAERILAKKTINGITQYHIKWRGYSHRENTWEPAENILDRGLISAFERTLTKKPRRGSAAGVNQKISSTKVSPSKQATPPLAQQATPPPAQQATPPPAQQATPPPAHKATPQSPAKPPTPSPTKQAPSPVAKQFTPPPAKQFTPPPAQQATPPPAQQFTTPPLPALQVTLPPAQQATPPPAPTSTNLKSAILNTVITDVTVNNQTITVCESKTNKGFFKQVIRHSVAVDTTH